MATTTLFRPHGQAVKTSPFHGGNTSSNLVGVIKHIWRHSQEVRRGSATPLSPVQIRLSPLQNPGTLFPGFFVVSGLSGIGVGRRQRTSGGRISPCVYNPGSCDGVADFRLPVLPKNERRAGGHRAAGFRGQRASHLRFSGISTRTCSQMETSM